MNHCGQRVLSYNPYQAHESTQRMLVCAHVKEAGHGQQRVDSTLERSQHHCAWHSTEMDVRNMARDFDVRRVGWDNWGEVR